MAVQLLHSPPPSTCAAPPTFEAVLARIAAARESIEIHMYVWRSDEIGQRVGRALLAAAERGVRVRIIKDLGAILFERLEMNRKSFFDTPLPILQRLNHRLIGLTFPDSFVEDEFTGELGEELLRHPGVTLEWVNHTHTKYYLFDERVLVTGSINIEDRHFGYHDYMAHVDDPDLVGRFRQRLAGEIPANPARPLEFFQGRGHLVPQTLGQDTVGVAVRVARLCGDGETGWHRDAEPGHVAEVGSLATEQSANCFPVSVDARLRSVDLVEPVGPFGGGHCFLPVERGRVGGDRRYDP